MVRASRGPNWPSLKPLPDRAIHTSTSNDARMSWPMLQNLCALDNSGEPTLYAATKHVLT
jgi:hypothetical protein